MSEKTETYFIASKYECRNCLYCGPISFFYRAISVICKKTKEQLLLTVCPECKQRGIVDPVLAADIESVEISLKEPGDEI